MTRRFHLIVAFAILGALLSAQEQPKPVLGSVQGSLFDASSGQPVSRATVSLKPYANNDDAGPITTATGPDGVFEFTEVPPGQYLLTASKAGFLDGLYGARFFGDAGTPISVTAGQGVVGLSFTLIPGVIIAGTVQNEDGAPVTDAMVRALQYRYVNHGKRLMPIETTTTNDRGEYRLHNLLPGSYYLACASSKSRALKENGKTFEGRYPITFYPSTANLEKAVALSMKAGDQTIANFMLAAARSYSIRGRVAGADATPPPSIEISPKVALNDIAIKANVTELNNFEIKGLLPGTYRLVAHGSALGRPARGAQTVTLEEADLNDVLIDLGKAAQPSSGYVSLPRGIRRDAVRVIVRLQPAITSDDEENDLPAPFGKENASTDSSGRFSGVTAERYTRSMFATVLASGPGAENFYVDSVRFNGQEVTNSGFDPTVAGMLSISLGNYGGMIQGAVAVPGGQPLAGATVSLYPDSDRRARPDLYRVVRADQNGQFTITGIPPGNYHVLAFEQVESAASGDPDYLNQYEHQSQAVRVGYRTQSNLQLTAVPAEPEKSFTGR